VAFVNPPARPGAVLWSIAAGPLVNVLLIPVTVAIYLFVRGDLAMPISGNAPQLFWFAVMAMNFGLLVFNMMPVYPLDGGQVLMSLLWFVIGRAAALKVASIIGLVAAGLLGMLALGMGDLWMLLITAFVALQAFNGFRLANAMARMDPRRVDERLAQRHADQQVEDRIRAEVDPWR
jgi:Zn-dependent protease